MAYHNPRGLAVTFFNNAWKNMQGWDWVSMLASADAFPTQREWVDTGLYVWDRMVLNVDTSDRAAVSNLAKLVVRFMSQAAQENIKGLLASVTNSDGGRQRVFRYTLASDSDNGDGELDRWLEATEDGYDDVESWSAVGSAAEQLLEVLPPSDVMVILAYVDGTAGSLREAADRYGVNYNAFNARKHRASGVLVRDLYSIVRVVA